MPQHHWHSQVLNPVSWPSFTPIFKNLPSTPHALPDSYSGCRAQHPRSECALCTSCHCTSTIATVFSAFCICWGGAHEWTNECMNDEWVNEWMSKICVLQMWKPKHKKITCLTRMASACDKTKSIWPQNQYSNQLFILLLGLIKHKVLSFMYKVCCY